MTDKEYENAQNVSLRQQEENPCKTEEEAETNPLREIERDVRELLRKYSVMQQEMEALQQETEADFKKMILSFIEIADSFENVFKNVNPKLEEADPQTKRWVSSFKTVYRMLQRAFGMWGIVPIETMIGEKANPKWHKVLEVEKHPEREDETIIEEIKKGYLWKGKLLRTAEIKAVSNL